MKKEQSFGLDCKVLKQIIKSFDKVWECDSNSDFSLEVTVPYVATNGDFIKIGLRKTKEGFEVSDNGYIFESLEFENRGMSYDEDVYSRVQPHFAKYFQIEKRDNLDGSFIFLKKAHNIDVLSNAVFDLAQFLATIRSTLEIEPESEKREEETFLSSVRQYITTNLSEDFTTRIKLRGVVTSGNYKLSFSATSLSKKEPTKFNVFEFITGSKERYYGDRVCRSSVLLSAVSKWSMVHDRFALLNDQATGYNPTSPNMRIFLENLQNSVTKKPINWSTEKDQLVEYLSKS